jgi:hypothetical protein
MSSFVRSLVAPAPRALSPTGALSVDDWAGLYNLDNLPFMLRTSMGEVAEIVEQSFSGFVFGAYLRNAVVFGLLSLRARLFGEARFQFQQLRGGKPGNLFGTPALGVLEKPEPGKATRDMLVAALLDADIGGNAFLLGRTNAIRRLRPDWTLIGYGSKLRTTEAGLWDPDAEVIGYGYEAGGPGSGETVTYLADEVAHFVVHQHPLTKNLGISALHAALREITGDSAATTHKINFFEHSATPNLVLRFPPGWSKEKAEEWIELFEQEHHGAFNAWRTVYLGHGIEAVPVGLSFQDMDYNALQGRFETRLAQVLGMHPVVAALSEGLQGSSLNVGNFAAAIRLVGDTTMRELWGNIANTLETIVPPPPGTRLWYDDDIPFLRNDRKDQAEITKNNIESINKAIIAGFEPDSARDAVISNDLARLVHTGLVSVQLQPPGTELPARQPAATASRLFIGSVSELRRRLAAGWTPATADDEAAVRVALIRAPDAPVRARAAALYRATITFWPVNEPLAAWGTVRAGDEVQGDHPLVSAYPSLFRAVEATAGPTPQRIEPLVTRAEVVAARQRLLAAGRPAGYDSLARELKVSTGTIRRRLSES